MESAVIGWCGNDYCNSTVIVCYFLWAIKVIYKIDVTGNISFCHLLLFF